jgi:hypothetical protein
MKKISIQSRSIFILIIFSMMSHNLQALSLGELVVNEPRRIKIKRGWVPGSWILDLNNRDINSLRGIEDIPGIEKVTRLYLSNNDIETIESGDFASALNLQVLTLSNNNINTIENNAFAGLKNLKVLDLSNNNIESIRPDGLNGMPGLRFLGMSSNPMINPKVSLQAQVPKAFITTLPITKENVAKWSAIVGTAVAALLAAVVGVKTLTKRKEVQRPTVKERPTLPATPPPPLHTEQLSPHIRIYPEIAPMRIPTPEELATLGPEELNTARQNLFDYLTRIKPSEITLYQQWEQNLNARMNSVNDSLRELDEEEEIKPVGAPNRTTLKNNPVALLSRMSGVELSPASTVEEVQGAYEELVRKEGEQPRNGAIREVESMFRTQAGRENWLAYSRGEDAVKQLALTEAEQEYVESKIFEIQQLSQQDEEMVSTYELIRERPDLLFIALQQAIENCKSDELQRALTDTDPEILMRKTKKDATLIELAILSQCPDKKAMIQALIKKNPDIVNLHGIEGKAPLHWAVLQNDFELVRFLAGGNNAKANERDQDGKTPLFYAYDEPTRSKTAEEIANLLLQKEARLDDVDSQGNTILHDLAARKDADSNLWLVQELLSKSNAQEVINMQNNQGETALAIAQKNDSAQAITREFENKLEQMQ